MREHSRSTTGWLPVAVVAALAVVASALHFLGGQVADPDLWQHLRFGEMMAREGVFPRVDTFSYTAHGAPLVNHEWLAQLIFAATFAAAGAAGLIALKLAVAGALLALLVDTARTLERDLSGDRSIHPLTVAAVLVLAVTVISPGATFRPQLFTILLLAVQGWLLARGDRRLRTATAETGAIGWELAFVPVLLVVWANLHGGFVVGVGMLGVYAAAVAIRRWTHPFLGPPAALEPPAARQVAAILLIALAGLLAPAVNPYGFGLYAFLGKTLGTHGEISEWYPIVVLSSDFLRFKLLVGATAAGCFFLWRRRRSLPGVVALLDWRIPFLGLAALYAFRHQRHTVLFAVAAVPLLVVATEQARRALLVRHPRLRPRRTVLATALAGVSLVAFLQIRDFGAMIASQGLTIRYGRLDFPADAIEFLRENGIRGNVAMPFEWGSYAIWKLAPDSRVFIDGRFETVYPERVIDDYFAFMHGTDGWERLLDEYPTEVVVVQRWREIHPRLFARADLRYVYSDPASLVFVRRTPTNEAALDRLARLWDRTASAPPETVFP